MISESLERFHQKTIRCCDYVSSGVVEPFEGVSLVRLIPSKVGTPFNLDWSHEMTNVFSDVVEGLEESGEFKVFFDSVEKVVEDGAQTASDSGISNWLQWGQIQDEILTAFLLDEEEWVVDGFLGELAKRLRSSVDEFQAIQAQTDPGIWENKRLLKLLEAESVRNKSFRWDQVESLALSKLHALVEKGKVSKLGELLAIAQTANRATRKNEGGGQMPANLTQVNVVIPGAGAAPTLPGPGNLGVMRLNLSDRTVKQLSKGKVIDHDAAPLSERIEMLGPEDVPNLSKAADER